MTPEHETRADEKANPLNSPSVLQNTDVGTMASSDSEINNVASSVGIRPDDPVGVQKAMALRQYMTPTIFAVVFAALVLTMFADRFTVYTATTYNAFATSAFSQHSLLSAAAIVNDIAQLCSYPIIAKLEDEIGRAEGFALATIAHILGSVMSAACPNVETYIAAGIFNAIGNTGFLLTEQVFVAESVSYKNRGLLSAIPTSVTGIIVLVAGSIAAGKILNVAGWRWGYGICAITLPACAAPLVTILVILEYRAMRKYAPRTPAAADATHGLASRIRALAMDPRKVAVKAGGMATKSRHFAMRACHYIWFDLDFPGALLLIAGLALILIPLSLTSSTHADRWAQPSLIAMLVVGAASLVGLVVWDGWYARKPIVPLSILRRKTIIAACLLGLFDFLAFSLFKTFFPSFLQVAGAYTPGNASLINNVILIAFQVVRLVGGLLIRMTKRPLIWIYVGVPMGMLGQGLFIRFTNLPNGEISNTASLVIARAIMGAARGLHHTAALVAVQCDVPDQELSMATAVFLALMNVGAAIGESMSGAIWRITLRRNLEKYLPDNAKSLTQAIFGSIVEAKKHAKGTAIRIAIDHAYRDSMSLLAIIATACMIPMLIFMLGIRNMHLEKMEKERKAAVAQLAGEDK